MNKLKFMYVKLLLIAFCGAFLLQGCAYILDGSTHPVSIQSTPSKASVSVRGVNGQKMGSLGMLNQSFKINRSTPTTIELPKNDRYVLYVQMEGYHDVEMYLEQSWGDKSYLYLGLDLVTSLGLYAIIDYVGDYFYKIDPDKINIKLETAMLDGKPTEYVVCDLLTKDDVLIREVRKPLVRF